MKPPTNAVSASIRMNASWRPDPIHRTARLTMTVGDGKRESSRSRQEMATDGPLRGTAAARANQNRAFLGLREIAGEFPVAGVSLPAVPPPGAKVLNSGR